MTYEKPQKQNPHNLTIRQHIIPQAMIKRFCSPAKTVQLLRNSTKQITDVSPKSRIFCAMRVWDQGAEAKFMKTIEDNHKGVVDSILSGSTLNINPSQATAISEFSALWLVRATISHHPQTDHVLTGITGLSHNPTKDEQERLEANPKMAIGFVRPDPQKPGQISIPARQVNGMMVRLRVNAIMRQHNGTQWGIVRAASGEFLVPDNFANSMIVPIAPRICLCAGSADCTIDEKEVKKINSLAVKSAFEWYFARDLTCCPR